MNTTNVQQKISEPQQPESSNRHFPITLQVHNANSTSQNPSLNRQLQSNLQGIKIREEPPPAYDDLSFNYQQDPAANTASPAPTHIVSANYSEPSGIDMTHQTALCLVNWVVAFSLCLIIILIYGAFNMFKYIRTENNFHLENQHDSLKNNL